MIGENHNTLDHLTCLPSLKQERTFLLSLIVNEPYGTDI